MNAKTMPAPAEIVAKALEHYAERGVFRAFSHAPGQGGKAVFKMMWHRDRIFECVFDSKKKTIRFPVALPNLPASSSMYKDFKQYLRARQSDTLPEHRRIDLAKAELKPYNRGGNVAVTLKVLDEDYKYGVRKIVHLLNEIYMDFLSDGRYYEYMVETFDLDPDHP